MLLTDDILAQWQQIIAEVEKRDVPLECIKKIVIKTREGQKTINILALKKQGLDITEIENIINRVLKGQGENVKVEFVLDAASVAELVQPETDRLLKNL